MACMNAHDCCCMYDEPARENAMPGLTPAIVVVVIVVVVVEVGRFKGTK